MHELSIAMGIVDIATKACEKANKASVTKISLEIGNVSGVQLEALNFVWPVAVKNSVLENAAIEIHTNSGQAVCLECSKFFEVETLYDNCPSCGSYFKNIVKGKELKVKYLEV